MISPIPHLYVLQSVVAYISVKGWVINIHLYLIMFACQCDRYRYATLPFSAAPVRYMFQQKIDEIIKDLPNVFGIADNILIVGYSDGRYDHDTT